MKIFKLLSMIIPLLVISSCTVDPGMQVKSVPSLISEKFLNNDEYEIVCLGFPKEGSKGIQKEETAKRAALLNAYYYTKDRFDETVIPDKDGRVEKFTMLEDHAELKYIIKKSNLKKRIKK